MNWASHKRAIILVNGREVEYQVNGLSQKIRKLQEGHTAGVGSHELEFIAELAPFQVTIAKVQILSAKNGFERFSRPMKRQLRGLNQRHFSKNFRGEKQSGSSSTRHQSRAKYSAGRQHQSTRRRMRKETINFGQNGMLKFMSLIILTTYPVGDKLCPKGTK